MEIATLAAVRKVLPQDNKSDLRLLLNKGKKRSEKDDTRYIQ